MQSHYIYALLSNNVYNDPTEIEMLPTGWEEFETSSAVATHPDFYAAAYINQLQKKLIIAFRGTSTLENIREDFFDVAFNKTPHLFTSNALPFVDAVTTKATHHYPDFEISFTGHSLGAILAELCAAKYDKHAITFESPGSGGMIINMAEEHQISYYQLSKITDNIFSYQAAKSAINRKNFYVGTRIRLYPDFDFSPPSSIPPLSNNCASLDIPTPGIFWEYSLQQHRMKNLLDQFDPVEGPMVYSQYFPSEKSGFFFSFDTWINYDENPYYWDQIIRHFYFPLCGNGQSLASYRESYINNKLHRNFNGNQQVGVTIHAPGSANYPALTIWGTTQSKDTLLFGKGKFKVIAYGFNTYKLPRDAQVSCEIEQMTLDSNHESRLFVGDQIIESNSEVASDFPMIHFTNSPSGQAAFVTNPVLQHTEQTDLLKMLEILFAVMAWIGLKNILCYKENKKNEQQALLNSQNRQQNYHTFSEAKSPASLPTQRHQKSPFIALSIYNNKIKSDQTDDALENNKPRREGYCAVM